MSNQHPHRIRWFEIPVTNLDKAAALYATTLGIEAGASVVQPTTDIGPFGTAAQFEDFDGNIVGLHAPR